MYLENRIEPDNRTERSKAQQMARRDPRGEEDLGERFSQFAAAHGTVVSTDLRSDNDTPALNARGLLPVAVRLQHFSYHAR